MLFLVCAHILYENKCISAFYFRIDFYLLSYCINFSGQSVWSWCVENAGVLIQLKFNNQIFYKSLDMFFLSGKTWMITTDYLLFVFRLFINVLFPLFISSLDICPVLLGETGKTSFAAQLVVWRGDKKSRFPVVTAGIFDDQIRWY